MESEARHQYLIYGPPSEQLPILAAIIQRKLDGGYGCLYRSSVPMIAGMRSTLMATGIDFVSEIAKARLALCSKPVWSDVNTSHKLDEMMPRYAGIKFKK
jgi:hypothetical protein